jgi:hypothetical protein
MGFSLKSVSMNNLKKAAGNVWSETTKKPTQAIVQSVQQGSAKPIQNYAQGVSSSVSKNLGSPFSGITDAMSRALEKAKSTAANPTGGPEITTMKQPEGLTFNPIDSTYNTSDFGYRIGGNEDTAATKAGIAAKYASMAELSKLKEGAQARGDQSAISRRLAASGMMGSGAGMRMQQQAANESGRRMAMNNLGLAAEQAGAEQQAQEAATARNLQREQLRMGASEASANRTMAQQSFDAEKELQKKTFERDSATIIENQKIAREIQRYNDRGLIGQLIGDLFGGGSGVSMKYPLGNLLGG